MMKKIPNKKQKNERNQKILSWLNFFFSSDDDDDSSQNIFIKTCDPLIKATASKVVGDDHISHGVKDELDVLGVSCTSHVAINFFCSRFVLSLKLSLDISCSFAIFLSA